MSVAETTLCDCSCHEPGSESIHNVPCCRSCRACGRERILGLWCSPACRVKDSTVARYPEAPEFTLFSAVAREKEDDFGPVLDIPCPVCGIALTFTGLSLNKQGAFIECVGGCGQAFGAKVKL